jgi:hypothetical protein
MTGPFKPNILDKEYEKFVESPTRANMPAVETVIGNVTELANAIASQITGGSSGSLESRNASETISALKCVYSISANSIAIAKNNVSFNEASVFGVAVTAANTNEEVNIQTYGVLRDTSFSWSANTQLYVDTNGSLTDVAPSTGFRTLVATAQGIGQIFINVQEPITL